MKVIKKITDKSFWYRWLFKEKNNKLHADELSKAVKELAEKLNEVIDEVNILTTKE